MREKLIEGMGERTYENYIDFIKGQLSEGKIPVWRIMRLWARIVKRTYFKMIGISLTLLGIFKILPFPIGTILGLIITAISIYLDYLEETKPLFA